LFGRVVGGDSFSLRRTSSVSSQDRRPLRGEIRRTLAEVVLFFVGNDIFLEDSDTLEDLGEFRFLERRKA